MSEVPKKREIVKWEPKKWVAPEPVPFKPIRKSAFMTYKKCPKKFWFSYFVHSDDYWNYNEKNNSNPAAAAGDIYHAELDELFTKIDYELLYELEDDKKKFTYFRNKFSYSENYETEKTDMDKMFDWTCEMEVNRSNFFKKQYTKTEYLKWYPPKACELKVSMTDEIDRTGHIDRVDYLPAEKAYCIVEYKTGKNYDVNKPWSLTSLRAETAFYAIICNEMELLDKPVLYWALYNPKIRQFNVEKFPAATMRAVNNTYKGLIQKIKESGEFPRKMSPLCMWCEYRPECFHGLKGEEKEWLFGKPSKYKTEEEALGDGVE